MLFLIQFLLKVQFQMLAKILWIRKVFICWLFFISDSTICGIKQDKRWQNWWRRRRSRYKTRYLYYKLRNVASSIRQSIVDVKRWRTRFVQRAVYSEIFFFILAIRAHRGRLRAAAPGFRQPVTRSITRESYCSNLSLICTKIYN